MRLWVCCLLFAFCMLSCGFWWFRMWRTSPVTVCLSIALWHVRHFETCFVGVLFGFDIIAVFTQTPKRTFYRNVFRIEKILFQHSGVHKGCHKNLEVFKSYFVRTYVWNVMLDLLLFISYEIRKNWKHSKLFLFHDKWKLSLLETSLVSFMWLSVSSVVMNFLTLDMKCFCRLHKLHSFRTQSTFFPT